MKYFTFVIFAFLLRFSFGDICTEDLGIGSASKRRGDNGYRLRVHHQPESYTSGTYSVILESTPPNAFRDFVLVAVDDEGASIGTLEILEERSSQMSTLCPGAVIHKHSGSKTSVTVSWLAPSQSGAGCVNFRAAVIQKKQIWFGNEGNLVLRLCERTDVPTEVPDGPDPYACCACNIAEYKATFVGLWTRRTHPKDYPSGYGNHWSDLIGASHNRDYTQWEEGGYSSEGMKRVAEWGSPIRLEGEMKLQGNNIRSIIKDRGLWPARGNMTARFETDKFRNLVSMVTMIGPSPDWFVGITKENLCTAECGWVERAEYDMLPWDAGTDSGITYKSRNAPTDPQERIHRITTTFPDNENNPFYDPNSEEATPLGKIVLERLSVSDGPCAATLEELLENEEETDNIETEDENTGGGMPPKKNMDKSQHTTMPPKVMEPGRYVVDCMMSEWSEWGECSKTCGKGRMKRTRMIKVQADNGGEPCGSKKESKKCSPGACPRDCMQTEWSAWSDCSVTCGEGIMFRMRGVKVRPRGAGEECGHPKEMKVCEMPVCESLLR